MLAAPWQALTAIKPDLCDTMLQATDLKGESLLAPRIPSLRVLILGTTHSLQRKVSKLHMAGLCWERLDLAGGQAGLVGVVRLSTTSAWILPLWGSVGQGPEEQRAWDVS